MTSFYFGIVGFAALLFAAFRTGSWDLYLNPHALGVVFGGTLVALLLLSPTSALRRLGVNLLELFTADNSFELEREDLLAASDKKATATPSKNPLIKYACSLWSRGVSQDMFVALLSEHRVQCENSELEPILTLKALCKYPSALGMMGTVTGIVTLFSSLTAERKASIGPALAVAMTSTFYGLLVAHLIVMPLADRLLIRMARKKSYLNSTYELLLLIERKEPGLVIEKELKLREAA
jgi:chemotaxis protein MotA